MLIGHNGFRKLKTCIFVCLFSVFFLAGGAGVGAAEYRSDGLIVKYKTGTTNAGQVIVNLEHGLVTDSINSHLNARRVKIPVGRTLGSQKNQLERDPAIEYVDYDYVRTAQVTSPNDTYYSSSQWNLRKISADYAWDFQKGSTGVIIAIVDTGVSTTHPDLSGKIVAGYDFVSHHANATDENGHGTHVAGIAAATTNNGTGIAGIDWNARIMPIRVLDASGSGWDSDVADGITWAADHGADVINLSLGSTYYSTYLRDAVTYAYNAGVIVIAAAGNNGNSTPFYPAAYDHATAVAATDSVDAYAHFSNYGSYVDIAAPGVGIPSTYWSTDTGNTYAQMSGTSMASPHVSGLAGLVVAQNPSATPDEIAAIITGTAVDLGAPGRDDYYGFGRIDAYSAVTIISGSISINSAAASTNNALVTLTLQAPNMAFTVTDMQFSNNNTLWSGWELFSPERIGWDLTNVSCGGTSGDGVKTVYVQFKDSNGNISSETVSDTIVLDTAPPTGTILINSGAAYTTSATVTLTLSAADTGGSGIYQMQFSNDNVNWSAPEAYGTTKSWTLSAGDGTKTVYARYTDNAGNISTGTISDDISLDTIAPVDPTVNSPSHTVSTWSNDNTVDVSWSGATDTGGSGVAGVSYVWSTSSTTTPDTTQDAAGASGSITSAALANANNHYFHLRTKDNAGNWTSTAHLGPFFIDTAPPTGTVTINGSASATNTPDVTLTSSAADTGGSGLAAMRFSNDGVFDTETWVTPYATSYAWTLTSGEGTKTVYAQYRDAAGNISTGTISDDITLDMTAPIDPAVNSPSHAVSTWSNDNTVDVSWSGATDTGGSGVSGVSYEWSQSATTTPNTSQDASGTAGSTTSSALANANNHYFHLRTKDNAGNWTSTVHLGPFFIDTAPPTGTILINSGAAYTTSATVTLTLSAADTGGSGIYQMQFSNDNVNWSAPEAYGTTKSWTLSAGDGTKTVYARYTDNAGNISTGTISDDITYVPPDLTDPSVTITSPGANSLIEGLIGVTATATDNAGIDRVEFYVDGGFLYTDSTAPYGFLLDVSSYLSGSHTVTAKAYDLSGNTKEDLKTYTFYSPIGGTVTPIAYLAEGYTGSGFYEYLCILNPNAAAACVEVLFMKKDGSSVMKKYIVPATSRKTINANTEVGAGFEIASMVKDDMALIAERPMYFNYGGWTGGHNVMGATGTASKYYFAEGYTGPGFDEYLCLMNPYSDESIVDITYYKDNGTTEETTTTVPGNSRKTIKVNNAPALTDGGVGFNVAHSTQVSVTSGSEIVAERPMYFNYGGWTGGHNVMGATSTASKYYFAEGYTGPGFDEYLCLMNPYSDESIVDITYYKDNWTTEETTTTVPGNSRKTIKVNNAPALTDGGVGFNVAHSTQVSVTSGSEIVAERPMYFNYGGWTGGHNVMGATSTATTLYFAEGYTGSGFNEFICLMNPNGSPATVTLTYMKDTGETVPKIVTVAANSRKTVEVHNAAADGGLGPNFSHSTMVTSDIPVIAERPMYFNFQGLTGGHDVVGATITP